jgi:hypothetical protein
MLKWRRSRICFYIAPESIRGRSHQRNLILSVERFLIASKKKHTDDY